ncbi:MAG TPA: glycosyl hydrolase [Candidatus Saccharimonadales bacterium]|nr:glycosyl hydrolase [Candidatus Saccharimonadales bacterium]
MRRRKTKKLQKHSEFSRFRLLIFIVVFGVLGIILWQTFAAPNPNLPGDINNDNKVDVTDLSILLSDYNTSTSAADLNSDGTVNVLDLSVLLTNYGRTLSAPTVSLSASPSSISSGSSATLTWSSSGATSCTASGSWSGTKATSGSASTGALTQTSTYTLTCTGTGGSNNASTTVTVTSGGGGTSSTLLGGAYEGADDPDGADWFAQTYYGKSAGDIALDFEASDTWANISGPGWMLNPWSDSHYSEKLVLGVPMLPSGSGTVSLATGATGAYNSYFQTLAQNLVNDGMDKTVIRLGWEFNGGWYKWAANGNTSSFISYWQQIVNTMRAVSGQHFKFLWNPVNLLQQFPAANAYPGDSYVDYIGDDVYNQSWISNYTDATARWNDIYNGTEGLAYWVSFAEQHNKPIVFPEWGTGTRSDGHGGGDDPNFIQNMYTVMTSTNTGFESYWDYCASDYCGELDLSPNSAAKFKSLFGG